MTTLEERVREINAILGPKGWQLDKLTNPEPEPLEPESLVGRISSGIKRLFSTPCLPNSYIVNPQPGTLFDEKYTPRCIVVATGDKPGPYTLSHIKMLESSVVVRDPLSGLWQTIPNSDFYDGLKTLPNLSRKDAPVTPVALNA